MLVLGPLWIVALVIGVAGAWKSVQPDGTRRALAALRVRVPSFAVRVLGAAEVVLAAMVLVVGGRVLAAAIAVLYVAFAVIAWRLRGRDVSCGCFGSASTRSSWWHVGVDVACAVVAAVAAVAGPPSTADAWGRLPLAGAGHVVMVVTGATAVIALLTVLPAAQEAARGPSRTAVPVLFRMRGERA